MLRIPRTALVALSFVLFSIVFSACYEPTQGCSDIHASNFDPGADETCCCTYPLLRVQVLHRIQDTIPLILNDSVYKNNLGLEFSILDFAYYLSDFSLFKQNTTYHVTDTIGLRHLMGSDTVSLFLRNDFALIRRNSDPIYTLDTFPNDGFFDGYRFRFGLKDSLKTVIPRFAQSGHPIFRATAEGLFSETTQEWSGLWMAIRRTDATGALVTDTLRFLPEELPVLQNNILSSPLYQGIGSDMLFTILVDYSLWMKDVDLSGNLSNIKAKIRQNIEGGVRVFQ